MLTVCLTLVSCLTSCTTMKIEVIRTFEMFVYFLLHVISQETRLAIATALKTSNFTKLYLFRFCLYQFMNDVFCSLFQIIILHKFHVYM
jgi:hypothetical protein